MGTWPLYSFYPSEASVNLELGLLKFRVPGSPRMPNLFDLYALIPIKIKHSDGAVFPHNVNGLVNPKDKLAVIG